MESERQSLEPVDDDMDETVETADEYALEPADSKKASAVSMSASERLGVELKKFEEARVNDIYFTSKYQSYILLNVIINKVLLYVSLKNVQNIRHQF